ncbi:hypothetical protein RP20_CCG014161 [Aedes albopictus]|nr:hypothetical protein RP20_CCG014161 [Aedes albopictus]
MVFKKRSSIVLKEWWKKRKIYLANNKVKVESLEAAAEGEERQDLNDMETQPQLSQEVSDSTKMDGTQQSLHECLKVKTEPHDEAVMPMSSKTETVFTPDASLNSHLNSASRENQQVKNEPTIDSENMIEIGEVKVETEEIDDGKPFKCNLCPKAFSLNRNLKLHFRNCHTPKIHDCDLCDTSFRRLRDLEAHKERHEREKEAGFYSVQAQQKAQAAESNDGTDEKDTDCGSERNSSGSGLQCAKCFKFWPNQNRLWLHYQAVHKEKFQCCLCKETFYYEVRLVKHMLLMHKQNDGSFKPLQCAQCGKQFQSRRQLTAHKQKHRPKNHKCEVCDQAFTLRSQLQTHMQSHRFDGVIWECEVCNKTFPSRKLRSTHMRIHAPKEHKCHICGKECRLRTNLLAHLRTHEGENFTLIVNSSSSGLPEGGGNSGPSGPDCSSPHTAVAPKNVKTETTSHDEVDSKPELNLKQETVYSSTDLRSNGEQTYKKEDDDLPQTTIDVGEVKVEPGSDDELEDKPASSETDTLDMSMIGTPENSGVFSFKCNLCGKVMSSRIKWWHHNRKVHGPRKFECPICGKPCFDKHTLQMHIPSHNEIKKRKRSRKLSIKAEEA